ncbi:ABC-three component system protein [Pseudomonas nitroreducens]|uniref:ABC-three component system protein n=1 Tax=Pseudomonas nitroreducens TaxID=46680 RepID=UPI002FE2F33D
MSMVEWVRREKSQNLVVFVHGLTGGMGTWAYDERVSFPSLLMEDPRIDGFDIACFNYFTTFTNIYGISKSFIGRMFGSLKSFRKNLPIEEIGELLKTEFSVNFSKYKKIIIIAHSMGGLISKYCILQQIENEGRTPVTGFISLAVPHQGAKAASIASLISKNAHVGDLQVLSEAIDKLNRSWSQSTIKPEVKYIYGAHDIIVEKNSAIPTDTPKADAVAVNEDHIGICKPKDCEQTIYVAVVNFIEDLAIKSAGQLEIKEFIDNQQYDDQFFVLKLILAEVGEVLTGSAKEYFFNAEEARKIFSSDHDRELLQKLYEDIRTLYRLEYEYHVANNTTTTQLVQTVHKKIFDAQDGYLKTTLSQLRDSHKMGMIHQLANKPDTRVVWSEATTVEALKALHIKAGNKGGGHDK